MFDAISALYIRHNSTDNETRYKEGISPGLSAFKNAYEEFCESNFYRTAIVCLSERIQLVQSLSGHTPIDDFETFLFFLEKPDSKATLESEVPADIAFHSDIIEIIDFIIDSDSVENDLLERTLSVCSLRAEKMQRKGSTHAEQDYLERLLKLAKQLDREEDRLSTESRLIESFEVWVEANEQYIIKAGLLRQGLAKCRDFMTEEQREEWRIRIQDYNEKGEPAPRKLAEFSVSYEPYVEQFRKIANETSTGIALGAIACWDIFLPDYSPVQKSKNAPLIDLFHTETIDNENLPVATNPPTIGTEAEPDQPSTTYRISLTKNETTTANFLRILIEEEDIKEGDLYCLFNRFRVLSEDRNVDDFAFLTDAVRHFFDEEYAAAIHIAMGRLEGVLRRSLEAKGVSTSTMKLDDSLQSQSLKDLADLVATEDENFGKYLRYRYADPAGNNERNKVAHSKLQYRDADFQHAIILLFDIIRIYIRIKEYFTAPHEK